MPESAKEIDLDPRRYVGLQLPLSADNVNNFALTKNSDLINLVSCPSETSICRV